MDSEAEPKINRTKEERLVIVLERLIELNQQLIEVFHEERQCLLKNDISGLKSINGQEMAIGNDLKENERERLLILKEFCEKYDFQSDPIRIQDLIKIVPENYGIVYERQAEKLKNILIELMKIRNTNNRIIERVLRFNEKNVKIFLELGKTDLAYDQGGKMNQLSKQVLNSIV